jgi:RimJ/RimL family protein N-acetyltransferase
LPDTPVLPDFPARHGDIPVSAQSAAFRRATRDDLTFLRELYCSLRIDEFASLGLPAEQLRVFLDHQFDLQHRSYVTTFPQADFLLILRENTPAGRLYLDASHEDWRIIDIGLTAERRSAGLGSAVMRAVKRHAQASAAAAVVLHVACENHGAQRFYRRLGFREVARHEQTYARIEWTPGPGAG